MKTNYRNVRRNRHPSRNGQFTILTGILLVALIGILACALDLGWIMMTKTQLHAAADSAALAGGTELLPGLGLGATKSPEEVDVAVRIAAVDYASRNRAGEKANVYVDSDRDITTGKAHFDEEQGHWVFEWGATPINAVRVTPRRDQGAGGGDAPLDLFFAPILGHDEARLVVSATAVILPANGFYIPPGDDSTADMLPFAFDRALWEKYFRARDHFENQLGGDPSQITQDILDEDGKPLFFEQGIAGNPNSWRQLFNDEFTWTEEAGVSSGPDGILEGFIFPISQTSGNFGTIDLGASSNSTYDIKRQITHGVNGNDLSYFPNNTIKASIDNPIIIEGDTGISGGIQKPLKEIIGDARAIALFTSVSGPGNNSEFIVNEFVGIRIMDVNLNGQNKTLVFQPAVMSDATGINDGGDDEIGDDTTIFTPLILAQ